MVIVSFCALPCGLGAPQQCMHKIDLISCCCRLGQLCRSVTDADSANGVAMLGLNATAEYGTSRSNLVAVTDSAPLGLFASFATLDVTFNAVPNTMHSEGATSCCCAA